MIEKPGVSIQKLHPYMHQAIKVIDAVMSNNGFEFVITSTFDGEHKPGSLHYQNLAFDFRKKDIPANKQADMFLILRAAVKQLSRQYQLVNEHNHFHIEYDRRQQK